MPIVEMVREADEFVSYQYGDVAPVPVNPFISGVTMPFYAPNIDVTVAQKNIGNLSSTPRTEYSGVVSGGITQLDTATTISNANFTNTVVDIRANTTFNNCHFIITNYTAADSIGALVRGLNGGSLSNIVFNNCEFHVRTQRSMNVFSGRNATFNKCVLTGGVDGLSLSGSGSATQSYGFVVNDSWIGDHAWWYWTSGGVVHTSDTQTHNDGIQISTNIGVTVNNTFFGTWPSEFIGTGTPGSGSETNTFTGAYITNQSVMEGWRATYLNRYTRADQSYGGVQRRSSTGGSWAGVMVNRPNVTVTNSWFSGGTVHVNAVDTNLAGQTIGSFTNNHHWNDMTAGHSLSSTDKGTAIYKRADSPATIPTSGNTANKWFDDTIVSPTNQ